MGNHEATLAILSRCADCFRKQQPFTLTEAEWLTCEHAHPLLEFLRGKASNRKVTLFAVACYRRMWGLAHERCRGVVEAIEQFVDGHASEEQVGEAYAAWISLNDAHLGQFDDGAGGCTMAAIPNIVRGGINFAEAVMDTAISAAGFLGAKSMPVTEPYDFDKAAMDAECMVQADLARDIFGNPLCPAKVDRLWQTPPVLDLAGAIYEDRRFDRLAQLAQALADAGCNEDSILSHCQQPGEHVRGCWVLDLVLGKE